jgi:hypothetical protein
MILNADDRPYRDNAAAAGDDAGRSVDHGRGYKAAPGFRQDGPGVIPGRAKREPQMCDRTSGNLAQ